MYYTIVYYMRNFQLGGAKDICVRITNNKWYDRTCESTYRYICEGVGDTDGTGGSSTGIVSGGNIGAIKSFENPLPMNKL